MKYEVRCCCQPRKLLGTIDIPFEIRRGDRIPVPNLKLLAVWEDQLSERLSCIDDKLVLTAEIFYDRGHGLGGGLRYLALKSNEIPIEQLRQIETFQETNQSQRYLNRLHEASIDGGRNQSF